MIEHYSPQNEAIRITQNYIEYASNNSTTTTNDETHFYNGMDGSPLQAFAPTGTSFVYKDIQFNNPIRPDDTIIIEMFDGITWINNPNTNRKADSFTTPTAYSGMTTQSQSDLRRYRVLFYSKASETATWASLVSLGYRWRVKKISGSNFAESVEVNKSVTVADNYSISQGISTVNVNASTATIDLSSVLLNSKVLIRKISAYDGNAITINASGATFEGLASIDLYGQYSYVELERISATVFAIKDLKDEFNVMVTTVNVNVSRTSIGKMIYRFIQGVPPAATSGGSIVLPIYDNITTINNIQLTQESFAGEHYTVYVYIGDWETSRTIFIYKKEATTYGHSVYCEVILSK